MNSSLFWIAGSVQELRTVGILSCKELWGTAYVWMCYVAVPKICLSKRALNFLQFEQTDAKKKRLMLLRTSWGNATRCYNTVLMFNLHVCKADVVVLKRKLSWKRNFTFVQNSVTHERWPISTILVQYWEANSQRARAVVSWIYLANTGNMQKWYY